jgi:hypothetical protein
VIEIAAQRRRLACRWFAHRTGSSGEHQTKGDRCDEATREERSIKLAQVFPLCSTEFQNHGGA